MLRNWQAAPNARQRGCCMSFIAELKRRKVIRAAAFCGASALIVQVSTRVSPFFGHELADAGKE